MEDDFPYWPISARRSMSRFHLLVGQDVSGRSCDYTARGLLTWSRGGVIPRMPSGNDSAVRTGQQHALWSVAGARLAEVVLEVRALAARAAGSPTATGPTSDAGARGLLRRPPRARAGCRHEVEQHRDIGMSADGEAP